MDAPSRCWHLKLHIMISAVFAARGVTFVQIMTIHMYVGCVGTERKARPETFCLGQSKMVSILFKNGKVLESHQSQKMIFRKPFKNKSHYK